MYSVLTWRARKSFVGREWTRVHHCFVQKNELVSDPDPPGKRVQNWLNLWGLSEASLVTPRNLDLPREMVSTIRLFSLRASTTVRRMPFFDPVGSYDRTTKQMQCALNLFLKICFKWIYFSLAHLVRISLYVHENEYFTILCMPKIFTFSTNTVGVLRRSSDVLGTNITNLGPRTLDLWTTDQDPPITDPDPRDSPLIRIIELWFNRWAANNWGKSSTSRYGQGLELQSSNPKNLAILYQGGYRINWSFRRKAPKCVIKPRRIRITVRIQHIGYRTFQPAYSTCF